MTPKEKEKCGKFFDEYDDVFLFGKGVPAADKAKVAKAVKDTAGFLAKRAKARSEGKPVPPPTPKQKADAKLLADMQLALVNKHFGPKVDWDKVQACFVAFANGDLRTGKNPPGRGPEREPNGAYFFLFAEFALLAVELGIDVKEWTELARIMVKAQEVFVKAYPPRAGKTGLFRPRRFKPGRQVDEKTKEKLHDKYKKKTLQEIIDCHNKHLKDAVKQPAVAFIPPTKNDGYLASLENRVNDLLDKAILLADAEPQPSALVYDLVANLRAVLAGSLGRYSFLKSPEQGAFIDRLAQVEDLADTSEKFAELGALRVQLGSIAVQSKGIGRDFHFDYQIGENSVHLSRDLRSKEEPYQIGAEVYSQVTGLNSRGPISLPVTINIVEEDPSYDDRGTVTGTLSIDPSQGSGTATISGSMEAQRAESGFANFEFSFDWELT